MEHGFRSRTTDETQSCSEVLHTARHGCNTNWLGQGPELGQPLRVGVLLCSAGGGAEADVGRTVRPARIILFVLLVALPEEAASRPFHPAARKDFFAQSPQEHSRGAVAKVPAWCPGRSPHGLGGSEVQILSLIMAGKSSLFKVILLGDGGVGKSSLMNRYVTNKFDTQLFHTIGVEFLNKDLEVDGHLVTMQIWDTAGQERFRSLRTPFYRGSDCCLLTFSVDDSQSFQNLSNWKKEFIYYADVKEPESFPFVILGNKVDINERQVSTEEAQAWCRDNGDYPYFETSAKDATNVAAAFEEAVRRVLASEDRSDHLIQTDTSVCIVCVRAMDADPSCGGRPRPACRLASMGPSAVDASVMDTGLLHVPDGGLECGVGMRERVHLGVEAEAIGTEAEDGRRWTVRRTPQGLQASLSSCLTR
ncbi:Ras-related protein Rab-9A [Galemys pyrenaicus]|uniref:small monomeric GTPase n=1 Tax=Galemys pyrenaicus TaxID=202257 RepID=A0A8J6AEX0_GALPY|nr:Ras-related protein Rab-9A [Galemys pyrenaicus]